MDIYRPEVNDSNQEPPHDNFGGQPMPPQEPTQRRLSNIGMAAMQGIYVTPEDKGNDTPNDSVPEQQQESQQATTDEQMRQERLQKLFDEYQYIVRDFTTRFKTHNNSIMEAIEHAHSETGNKAIEYVLMHMKQSDLNAGIASIEDELSQIRDSIQRLTDQAEQRIRDIETSHLKIITELVIESKRTAIDIPQEVYDRLNKLLSKMRNIILEQEPENEANTGDDDHRDNKAQINKDGADGTKPNDDKNAVNSIL